LHADATMGAYGRNRGGSNVEPATFKSDGNIAELAAAAGRDTGA